MQKLKIILIVFTFLTVLYASLPSAAAQSKNYFGNWEKGSSPQEIGKRVAENFQARKFDFETNPKREYVIYPEICGWYGSLTVADQTKDKDLSARLMTQFDRFFAADANRVSPNAHVDYRVFGIIPLEVYIETKNPKYLALGQSFADKQWEKTTPDGITAEARYWIDDMYMITMIQVQAYRATKDKKYLDRAALAASSYLKQLQQPNGLFFHAPDSQFYWGRGNGWGPAARKAWLGLIKHIDSDANVTDVCVGTNKGFSVQYYLDRERKTGDLHGQSPVLWTATALLR